MANWRHKLDLSAFYHKDEFDPVGHGTKVGKAIREQLPKVKGDLIDIRNEFEAMSEHETADDFDEIMVKLFDWGDEEVRPYGKWPHNRCCWIETGFAS